MGKFMGKFIDICLRLCYIVTLSLNLAKAFMCSHQPLFYLIEDELGSNIV